MNADAAPYPILVCSQFTLVMLRRGVDGEVESANPDVPPTIIIFFPMSLSDDFTMLRFVYSAFM